MISFREKIYAEIKPAYFFGEKWRDALKPCSCNMSAMEKKFTAPLWKLQQDITTIK